MFGTPTIGDDREQYDSKSESDVARVLRDLTREQVVRGYMPHPFVAGMKGDFLVMLGPDSGQDRRLVVLEYDGLGMRRPKSLAPKLARYRQLALFGIEDRWITSTAPEAIKKALTDYEAPHFITRRALCPSCGAESSAVVIATDEVLRKRADVETTALCSDCD